MRFKLLIIFLAFCLLGHSSALCQKKMNKEGARRGEALNFELVQQKQLGENNSAVRLGSIKTDSAPGLSMFIEHRLLPDGRNLEVRVNFFDEQGSLVFSKELNENMFVKSKSEAGNYMLLITILKEGSKGSPGTWKYELLDSRGSQLWSVLDSSGDESRYYLSNTGLAVKVYDISGVLVFLNRKGETVKEVTIFNEQLWSRGRGVSGAFSQDGRYFAANACDNVGTTFAGASGLLLFDNQGNELWRHQLDERRSKIVAISPQNNVVLTTSSTINEERADGTYLFDIQGGLVKKLNIHSNLYQFSPEGDYACIIGEGAQYLHVINTKTGQSISGYSVYATGKSIYSADYNPGKKLVGLILEDEIVVMHPNRVPAWKQAISTEETSGAGWYRHPEFRFSGDGEEFTVVTFKQMSRYKLVRRPLK